MTLGIILRNFRFLGTAKISNIFEIIPQFAFFRNLNSICFRLIKFHFLGTPQKIIHKNTLLTHITTASSLVIRITSTKIIAIRILITISIRALWTTHFSLTESSLITLCITSARILAIRIHRTKSVNTRLRQAS